MDVVDGFEVSDAQLVMGWQFNPNAIELHAPDASFVGETGLRIPRPMGPRPGQDSEWKVGFQREMGSGRELATALATGDEESLEHLRESRVRKDLLAKALAPHGGMPKRRLRAAGSSLNDYVQNNLAYMLTAPMYDGPYTERPERVDGRRAYLEMTKRKEICMDAALSAARADAAGSDGDDDEPSGKTGNIYPPKMVNKAGKLQRENGRAVQHTLHVNPTATLDQSIAHILSIEKDARRGSQAPGNSLSQSGRKGKHAVIGGAHRPYGLSTDGERRKLSALGRYNAMYKASMQIALGLEPRAGRPRAPWTAPPQNVPPKHLERSQSGKKVVNEISRLHARKNVDLKAIHKGIVATREAIVAEKVEDNPLLAVDRIGMNIARPTTGEWTAQGRREAILKRAALRDARRVETLERAEQERRRRTSRALDIKDQWETKMANHASRVREEAARGGPVLLEPGVNYAGKLFVRRSVTDSMASVSNEGIVMRRIAHGGATPPPVPVAVAEGNEAEESEGGTGDVDEDDVGEE